VCVCVGVCVGVGCGLGEGDLDWGLGCWLVVDGGCGGCDDLILGSLPPSIPSSLLPGLSYKEFRQNAKYAA
jgi:hypothetical protein